MHEHTHTHAGIRVQLYGGQGLWIPLRLELRLITHGCKLSRMVAGNRTEVPCKKSIAFK